MTRTLRLEQTDSDMTNNDQTQDLEARWNDYETGSTRDVSTHIDGET